MIHLVRNKLFPSNTYLLSDEENKVCLVIDPGLDEVAIDNELQKLNLTPLAILATHGHFDHVGSASFLKSKYNIPLYLHEADFKISQSVNFFLKVARINHKVISPTVDFSFKGLQESLSIEGFNLKVYNFPGHTAGSCVIQFENNLFTGDLFYKKGLGSNNFPGEDKIKLRKSILEIFESFPDDTMILPGHGESATLGAIKKANAELQDFLNKNHHSDV
jgi:hydroxyacylglutathione hydrolase